MSKGPLFFPQPPPLQSFLLFSRLWLLLSNIIIINQIICIISKVSFATKAQMILIVNTTSTDKAFRQYVADIESMVAVPVER